ncbi:SIR2 family protein [Teredinibacter turnerae]|uniref:SIR2 family protein n=1 Tax=Teredinibacter turnerae TaxID=2426 RepID=UPI00040ABFE9|nr:SIR2 family protein [Teredinibacter turnerae]
MTSDLNQLIEGIRTGSIVPYLGPGTLSGVTNKLDGAAIPADSESLILAMTNGQPMSPRLMYEFPRAAMHLENKKGRSFIENFLTKVYGETQWSTSELHVALADMGAPYVIDVNRDIQLLQQYTDREHTLIVGAARLAAHPYRFDIYHFVNGNYTLIEQDQVNPKIPAVFKPLGCPLPKPSYVASDADFVDYITELMGGFAIPTWLKDYRQEKQYLFLGMRFTRDTERMVMSDLIYGANKELSGWALIKDPTDKERKFLDKKNIQLIEQDWVSLLEIAAENAA